MYQDNNQVHNQSTYQTLDKKYGQYSGGQFSNNYVQPQQQIPANTPQHEQFRMFQQLMSMQQQPQQHLNISGSQGSNQNQNLGPTQIFYQQPPVGNSTQLMLLQLLQQQQQQLQGGNQIFGQGFQQAAQLLNHIPKEDPEQSFRQSSTRKDYQRQMKVEESFHSSSYSDHNSWQPQSQSPAKQQRPQIPVQNDPEQSDLDIIWPSKKDRVVETEIIQKKPGGMSFSVEDDRPITGGFQPKKVIEKPKPIVNIDDQIIPAARSNRPTNFEELLEQNLAQEENFDGESAIDQIQERKKEFLKRRLPITAPNAVPPTKKYSYYADAVQQKIKGSKEPVEQPPMMVQRPQPKVQERNKSVQVQRPQPKMQNPNPAPMVQPLQKIEQPEQKEIKQKKPFLKSGQGKNAMQRPVTARPERVQSPKNQPKRQSSMDEFEKLEMACNVSNNNTIAPRRMTNKPQNQKKLFDDSESETSTHSQGQDPRSNIVKKIFYPGEQKQQKVQQEIPDPQVPNQMQSMLDQKMAQLDQAIANYNQESDKLQRQKIEYEQQSRKLKLETRDIEAQKKRLLEDVERIKQEEYKKITNERKALESRQKNLQMASQTTRKEREEIENLKKEIGRITAENEVKQQKMKKDYDRIKKVNQDLEIQNGQLEEEVKILQHQLMQATKQQRQPETTKAAQQSEVKTQQVDSRYSFTQKQEVIQQRPVKEQPKQAIEIQEEFQEIKNQIEEEDYSLKFLPQYHQKTTAHSKVVDQVVGHDGKIQRIYQSGKKEVIFTNGVKRETHPDGYTIVYFANEDVKQTYPDQKVVYYFAEAKTTQTTFADGLQVFKFSNQQIEKHFPDGTKEIIFPDGTIKCIFQDGEEESIFPDGTIQRIEKNGIKAIEFANGQKDILYPDGTRVREFPDGRIRKTFPDGRTETKNN